MAGILQKKKYYQSEKSPFPNILDWHKAVICALFVSFLGAFIAFQFLICAAFIRIAAVVANVLILIAGNFYSPCCSIPGVNDGENHFPRVLIP